MSWDSFSLLSELSSGKPCDLGKQGMLPPRGPAQVRVSWLGCSSAGQDLGFPVDSEANASQQCALVAIEANHTPGCTCEKDKDGDYSSLLC